MGSRCSLTCSDNLAYLINYKEIFDPDLKLSLEINVFGNGLRIQYEKDGKIQESSFCVLSKNNPIKIISGYYTIYRFVGFSVESISMTNITLQGELFFYCKNKRLHDILSNGPNDISQKDFYREFINKTIELTDNIKEMIIKEVSLTKIVRPLFKNVKFFDVTEIWNIIEKEFYRISSAKTTLKNDSKFNYVINQCDKEKMSNKIITLNPGEEVFFEGNIGLKLLCHCLIKRKYIEICDGKELQGLYIVWESTQHEVILNGNSLKLCNLANRCEPYYQFKTKSSQMIQLLKEKIKALSEYKDMAAIWECDGFTEAEVDAKLDDVMHFRDSNYKVRLLQIDIP